MNINLDKHDVGLILDALESYQLDIEHGNKNGHEYIWTETDVENLSKYLKEESYINEQIKNGNPIFKSLYSIQTEKEVFTSKEEKDSQFNPQMCSKEEALRKALNLIYKKN